jgi:hypothetical protein
VLGLGAEFLRDTVVANDDSASLGELGGDEVDAVSTAATATALEA